VNHVGVVADAQLVHGRRISVRVRSPKTVYPSPADAWTGRRGDTG